MLAERIRIARDFHDTVAQSLSAVISQLDAADSLSKEQPQKSNQYLLRARDMAANSLVEARRALWRLRSESLNASGIVGALQQIISKTEASTKVRLEVHGSQSSLHPELEETLLRIGQEALNNALQHADAESIRLDLSFEPSFVHLKIEDDGSGYDIPSIRLEKSGHYGLKGMQERAERLNGSLEVISQPGNGTTVSVSIPLHQKPPR